MAHGQKTAFYSAIVLALISAISCAASPAGAASSATAAMGQPSAGSPLLVTYFWGGSAQAGIYHSAVVMTVKNPRTDVQVVIKAVDTSGSLYDAKPYARIYWGSQLYNDTMHKLRAGPNYCEQADHQNFNCNIVINPGQSTNIMVWTPNNPQCALSAPNDLNESINSVRIDLSGTVKFYYKAYNVKNGQAANVSAVALPNTLPQSVKIGAYAKCDDYFICKTDQDCKDHYNPYMPFACGEYGNCWYAEKALKSNSSNSAASGAQSAKQSICPGPLSAKANYYRQTNGSSGNNSLASAGYPCILPSVPANRTVADTAKQKKPGAEKADTANIASCVVPKIDKTIGSIGTGRSPSGSVALPSSDTSGGPKSSDGSAVPPSSDSSPAKNSVANAIVDKSGDIYMQAALLLGIYFEKFRKP